MVTKRTRLLSGLVAILMLISMFTAFSVPVIAESIPLGTSSATGLVNVEDLPDITTYDAEAAVAQYKVTDYEGMKMLANLVYGGNNLDNVAIYQANDIDMEGTPFPGIGRNGKSFSGIFDGNGFTIDNLYILRNDESATGAGLFGELSGAEIRNVGISGGLVVGRNATAAIAGTTAEGTTNVIRNCWNAATVVGAYDNGTAGILAHARAGSNTVENCYNLGMILSTAKTAAGILGWAVGSSTTVKNCYNAGEIVTGFTSEAAYTPYSAILAVDMAQPYVAGSNNFFIKNRGVRISIDEHKAATGDESIKAIDGATGLEEVALTDGTLAANLSSITSNVDGWELSFTDVGAGYPVITYTQAVEGAEDIVIARAAKSDINVNGDQSWAEDSELFAKVYAARNKGLSNATLSNIYIKSANDLFALALVTIGSNFKSALGTGNNGYVYLANDVDMKDQTLFPETEYALPISSGAGIFNGTFDGQKNTIFNWNVYAYFAGGQGVGGLFPQVNGTVQNLGMANATSTYERMSGETAGWPYPALMVERKARTTAVLTMNNCFATGTLNMVNVSNTNNNGGVFSTAWADTNYPTITNCWADVDVVGEARDGQTKARVIGKLADAYKSTVTNCYYVANQDPKLGRSGTFSKYGNNMDNNVWYYLRNSRLPESHYSAKDGSLAAYFNSIGYGSWTVKNGTTVFKKDTDSMFKVTLKKMINAETGYIVSETYYAPGETVTIPGEIDGYTRRLGGATIQMPANDLVVEYTKDGFDRTLAEEIATKYGNGNYDAELFMNGSSVVQAANAALAALQAADDATATEQLATAVAHANKAGEPVLLMEVGAYPYYSKKDVYAPLMTSQDWGISSRADWEAAVADTANNYIGYTLHFNNDVDMLDQPIAPLCYDAANADDTADTFRGTINGHGFKILNLKINWDVANGAHVGLVAAADGATIRDLTIENGSISIFGTNNSEHNVGAFLGAGDNCIIFNCVNNADVDATGVTAAKGGQSISGIARVRESSVIDSCFNTGDISAIGYAYGIGGYVQGSAYVFNCGSNGKLTSQNGTVGLARYSGGNKDAYMANSYIVGYDYCTTQNHATEAQWRLEEEEAAAGALAGLLNYNHYNNSSVAVWRLNPAYTDNSRPYYMVDENGNTVRCTSAEQTRTLAMNCEGHETKYLFGENGDTVTLNYAENVTYDLDSGSGTLDKAAGTFTFGGGNAVVYVTNHGKLYDVMDAALATFDGSDPKFFASEGVDDFAAFVAEVRGKRAADSYADQAEIDADVAVLQAAKWIASYPNLPKASQYDKYSGMTSHFIVDSLDEMNYVANNKGKFAAAVTIHFGANVTVASGAAANSWNGVHASIDGHNYTIKGINVTSNGWLGNYTGTSIKNITFEDCHLTNAAWNTGLLINQYGGTNITLENVTMKNCSATKGSSNGMSLMVGSVASADKTITYKNIVIEGCTLNRALAANNLINTGFLGGTFKGKLYVDGVYLNGNKINNKAGNQSGILFGELKGPVQDVKNVYVANTTLGTSAAVNGILAGLFKDESTSATMNYSNIVALNNGSCNTLVYNNGTGTGTPGVNLYTDVANVYNKNGTYTTNNVAQDTADMASGLAAYIMNQTGAHWTTSGGKAILTAAVEGGADTIAVTFKASDVLYDIIDESKATATLYTDAEGKLLGLDAAKAELSKWAIWDYDAIEAATYDVENNVAYGTPILAHEHVWSYTSGNGTHDAECIWDNGEMACPWYVEDVACEYTEGAVTVDPNAAPENAMHAGTCACGNVSDGVLCSSDAENWIVTVTKKATCYEPGNTNYLCLTCGYVANVEIAQRQHNLSTWVADKNEDESFKFTHTAACTHTDPDCEYTETKDCTFGDTWAETKAPSVTEEGEEIRYCSEGCGSYETRSIPALTGFVVEPELGLRGDTMEVYVDIKNNPGISGAVIDITYDSANIELENAELVIDQKDQQIPAPGLTQGEGTMVTSTVSFAFYGDYTGEDLLKLTFKVKDEAAVGKHSFTVTTEEHAIANNALQWVEVKDWAGEIEIADFIRGDVDRDRVVTIADAVLLLRYCNADEAGKESLIETYDFDARAADINSTQGVEVGDVIVILQYLNHMITEI